MAEYTEKYILYRQANIPKRHINFRPKHSTHDQWNSLYEDTKEKIDSGSLIAIVGTRGTGKTQIGACLIGYCTHTLSKQALYIKAFEIFLKIRDGFNGGDESESGSLKYFITPHLLVIDAYEVRSDSQFENRVLDHIIDKRYDLCKSTIIISNDTVETFQKTVGLSICDRIRETGGIIEMKWQSFRIDKPKLNVDSEEIKF